MQKPHPIHSSSVTVFLAQTWACLILCTYYFCPNKFASCHCNHHLVPFLLVLYDLDIHDEELASERRCSKYFSIVNENNNNNKSYLFCSLLEETFPNVFIVLFSETERMPEFAQYMIPAKPNDHSQKLCYLLIAFTFENTLYWLFSFIKEIEYLFFANIAIGGCPSAHVYIYLTKRWNKGGEL